MKHFLLILLASFLLGNARAQISNGQVNYELRVDQFRQTCDNDALSADDNEVRIGLTSDGNTGGTATWTSGGNGASCGGNLYVRRWQADAPSTVTNTNTLLYLATNRNNAQDFFTINHASWEEDGAPDCDPSGDACQSSGTWSYTFKSATKTPSLWWGNNGTANGAFVTGQSGDFLAKSVWRYTNGESCANPLIFGSLSNGVTYTHTNSNRLAPAGASISMGYTNTAGNVAQDVYYQFTISTASTVTISTVNGVTNFDSYLRLYSSGCGTQLEFNDDFSGTMSQISSVLCPGTYIVMVEGFSANSGDFQLSVLANSITSSGGNISGITNGVSVCSGSDPGAFTGTAAIGAGLLTYQWEISTTSSASGYSSISGETGLNYDPGTVSQTTWFRRRVTDACGNVSYSNVVQVQIATLSNPPTSISGVTTLCAGSSATLTQSGGTAGTGAVAQWYSGSCGGTFVGTGNSVLVSPAATTTYFVRYAGTCNTTTCASVTVTVNTLSTAPTSISGTTTLCAGNSTTLTLSGGTAGTGAVSQWYSGACGGTLVGTGNSVSVSPTNTTTYFVRYAGSCNTTSCASVTVTVNSASSAVTTISGPSSSVCPNTTTTLTASGGTAGSGSQIYWYSGPNGTGSLLGTGTNLVVSPNATTTYYVRREGTCNTSADLSYTLNVKSYIYAANGTTSNTYCTDNSGWNHFYTGDNIIYSCLGDFSGAPAGYPIVTINNNAGFYQMSEGPNTAPDCSSNLTPGEERFEMSRNWNLDFGGGTVNPPYSVRFYYQPAEKTAIELAANNWMSTYPDCGYSYKYPTPNGFYWFKNNGMNYIPASYDGLHLSGIVSTTPNGINYTEMNGITSFSGGSGGIILTPITTLPVELLSFHSACDNATNNIDIYWTTLSEHNSSHFIIERSINGQDWTTVGTADAAGTSIETNNYHLTDLNVGRNQLIYYKLKQVDLDGSISSYDLIAQKCGDQLTDFELFPNPADSWVNISIQTVFESNEAVSIQFYDVHGRLVKTTRYSPESGKVMGIDISSLKPGVYFAKWSSGNTESEPIRFVKD